VKKPTFLAGLVVALKKKPCNCSTRELEIELLLKGSAT
jgi:hypothetical protein